jgi:hypothetical protein
LINPSTFNNQFQFWPFSGKKTFVGETSKQRNYFFPPKPGTDIFAKKLQKKLAILTQFTQFQMILALVFKKNRQTTGVRFHQWCRVFTET